MNLFENNAAPVESPILFIIGNGFDLGLDMKTKYEDVYETYCKNPSDSDVIKAFKDELSRRKPYDKWSDFEMGMADYAKRLANEAQLIECVRDFKSHMVEHLRSENNRIKDLIWKADSRSKIITELDRSFREFYDCFSPNLIRKLDSIVDQRQIDYPRIITFNYTTTLEELLNVKERVTDFTTTSPLHIHGSLENDVVLGVDNINQLQGRNYNISKRGSRAFIKTFFNQEYDNERVSNAQDMILDSSIICTYGFSLGDSDKTWVDFLIGWLNVDPSHHLIVYEYDEKTYPRYNYDVLMDAQDEKKEALFKRLNLSDEKLMKQIHIPVGYDIFNFDFTAREIVGTGSVDSYSMYF